MRVYLSALTLALSLLAIPASAQTSYWANFQTNDGVHWLTAENGGGGSNVVVADRTAAGAWETIQVIDTNGGSLVDGDHVVLKSINGTTFRSNCSSTGPLYTSGGSGCLYLGYYGHFIMYKVGGSGGSTISSGDQVAIANWATFYLVVADWGGGSTVNVNSTNYYGPDETFTIYY